MKTVKIQNIKKTYNPLDLVEDIIITNQWEYEKDINKNIHVEVGGKWCDYQLSYGINEDIKLIYISCALDIKIPELNRIDLNSKNLLLKSIEIGYIHWVFNWEDKKPIPIEIGRIIKIRYLNNKLLIIDFLLFPEYRLIWSWL